MNWINIEELLLIHEKVIEATGGVKGILNFGHLETSLLRPYVTFDNKDLFPDLFSKVSVLIHSIILFHPFIDGNKRAALVAADICLKLNGYRIIPSKDVETFFWSIARGEKNIDNITDWLHHNTEPIL